MSLMPRHQHLSFSLLLYVCPSPPPPASPSIRRVTCIRRTSQEYISNSGVHAGKQSKFRRITTPRQVLRDRPQRTGITNKTQRHAMSRRATLIGTSGSANASVDTRVRSVYSEVSHIQETSTRTNTRTLRHFDLI